jgi:hypothetical protein
MSDSHAAPLEQEPQTPMWLPALGAALFVAVGLWWAVTPSAPPISADTAASASAPAPSVAITAAPAAPPTHAALNPAPSASGHPAMGAAQPVPDLQERMRKMKDQINMKNAGGHR